MTDKLLPYAAVVGKFSKWLFGRDSTAIATWAMLIAGCWVSWKVVNEVYLPERERQRQHDIAVADKLDATVARVQSIADSKEAACDRDKDRIYKVNEQLMQRVDRMLEQSRFASRPMDVGVVGSASPPEFECDP